MRWLVMPFLRYADFKGRSGRTEFWTFFGFSVAALILAVVATGLLADTTNVSQPKAPGANASPAGTIGYMLWWLASIVPWFAVQVRRFHDQGRSGWLCLIGAAGYVATGFGAMPLAAILLLVAMVLMALPGEKTENCFGPTEGATEDYDAAPVAFESPLVDAQIYGLGMAGSDPEDSLTSLELSSQTAEPLTALPVADAILSNIPEDVKPDGNGRFTCGGYAFTTLEQAVSFAKRRNDRVKEIERSVSPFSFVPTPKPPQPTPSKGDRSGFLGFGSSAKRQTVAEYWVETPTHLTAGGVPFEGHLVYFGTRPRSQQYERHRSLIDPNLDVSNGRDPHGSTFSYWPNYSELRPEARRSYVEWLSAGRSNPSTPIGYVFIYFYGLERRLVKDRSEADAPAIMSELRRLLAIYGENHSFKNYCSALLDMGELLFGNVEETPTPTLDNRYSWELPIRLRVYLGKKVAAGGTLDSNDALCWTLGHPMLYPRTPVTRCFAEFCQLWKIRFDEQFPKGLSAREPKARLNFQYRSASSEFAATATIDDLPDVSAISGPISKFELLLGSCSDELDPLSRFLGRNPAEKDSAIAGALVPEPLRDNGGQSNFVRFSQFLVDASLQSGIAEVGIPEIMVKLGFPDAGKADERRTLHLKRLPELFDAAGFGFEPDKRFGPAPSLSEDLKLCVFPAERGGPVNANRPEYLAARTMAEIAALAARADDLVVDVEIESITSDLISFPEISDLDRSRLRAHALALLANPSKLKAATKRLCELPAVQREAALASAVRAVLADQRITPSEVRFLEGLYKALGLPQDEVYSRLHSGEATAKPASKSALPSAPGLGRDTAGTEIDHEKLARLKEETSAVSSMLASIFKEDEATAKPTDEKPVVEVEFAGLDGAHSSLLVRLTEAPMESDAFDAICRNHKLLPSGAIETINDWAFDALDDYAIEEGELICIQEHLIEPIKAMRKAI